MRDLVEDRFLLGDVELDDLFGIVEHVERTDPRLPFRAVLDWIRCRFLFGDPDLDGVLTGPRLSFWTALRWFTCAFVLGSMVLNEFAYLMPTCCSTLGGFDGRFLFGDTESVDLMYPRPALYTM